MRPDIPVSECSRIESEFNIPEKVRKTIYREEEEAGGKGGGEGGETDRSVDTSKFLFLDVARKPIDLFAFLETRRTTTRNWRLLEICRDKDERTRGVVAQLCSTIRICIPHLKCEKERRLCNYKIVV